MNAIQIIDTRELANSALCRAEQTDRPVSPDDIKVELTGKQYLRYYTVRYQGVNFLPAKNQLRRENPDGLEG